MTQDPEAAVGSLYVCVSELEHASLFLCGSGWIRVLFFFHMLSWINDAMVTKASALWDLAVLHCNKRESGQAPSDSVVLHNGSRQANAGCMWERWRVLGRFGVLLNINKMVGYDLDWMTATGDTYLWDLVSDYKFLHKELEE